MKNTPMFIRIRKSTTIKFLMAFVAINMVVQMAFPTVAMALTAGAASPEFASFEPVATTDMVNDFTGDFTYNLPVLSVPGPDGGGYSMSLSYHSGGSSEEEASWVGFGWTLNPGAINRQKRGFADDFNGVDITRYNKTEPNWTHASTFDFSFEIQSRDKKSREEDSEDEDKAKTRFLQRLLGFGGGGSTPLALIEPNSDAEGGADSATTITTEASISLSKSIRYNNYSGFSIVNGFGIGVRGLGNLNMNRSAGETTLGFTINYAQLINKATRKIRGKELVGEENVYFKEKKKSKKTINKVLRGAESLARKGIRTALYTAKSYNAPAVAYSVSKTEGDAYNFSTSLQVNPAPIDIGVQVGVKGNFNYQVTSPLEENKAYGYLYPRSQNPEEDATGGDQEDIEGDYQLEKASTFNKHDRNLGIPFNNADLFSATGNGVVGGFKVYHNQIGHYYPPYVENRQTIKQLGVEVGIGLDLSVGLDLGLGFQKTTMGDWRNVEGDFNYITPNNPNYVEPYMRFNNDMGGQIDYSGDEELITATVGGGILSRHLNLESFTGKTTIDGEKTGRTSFIEYQKEDDLVTGMVVTDKDGNVSSYTEPCFVYEETQLNIGLDQNVSTEQGTLKAILQDGDNTPTQAVVNHPLNFETPIKNKTAVGQRIRNNNNGGKYASAYLLTANTTFDYVDVNSNGEPDREDFGGWTKFDYRTTYDANNLYRFRSPYTGLNYDRGRLLDGDDQTGSMSSGLKEVKYLKTVETKTHIAFFITNNTTEEDFGPEYAGLGLNGSGMSRLDGLGAAAINGEMDPAAEGAIGNKQLDKLERIVLYGKNDLTESISATYFEYDYQLVQEIPNTIGAGNQRGKLTLKKVWTESGGTLKSRIAPYHFEYEYFLDYSDKILNKYPDLLDGYAKIENGNRVSAFTTQNPDYKYGQLDMWGNYRIDGVERFENMQPWVNQQEDPDFDPAAWQLKRIKLPSGGEIHVQYEQKNYRFVQDQKAMVMTSLLEDSEEENTSTTSDNAIQENRNKYFINLENLGIDPSNTLEVNSYVDVLRQHFVELKNKLYFRMLYSLTENYQPTLNNFNHRYDYITGYTSVNEVGQDTDGNIYLSLGNKNEEDNTIPRRVGYRKLHEQGGTALGPNAHNVEQDNREILERAYNDNTGEIENIGAVGRTFSNTFNLFRNWISGEVANVSRLEACETFNHDLSYFKLPIANAKKGGGIRVKRLLSYDPGIVGETGDEMVYGSEYIYKNSNGKSSGVATNEPPQGREESPLTTIVERNKQSGWNRLLNGEDSKQHEGPLGENVLPGAQVAYERVIVKNIHSEATTTGYLVNNYHTTREFPMLTDFTEISKQGDAPTYKKINQSLSLGLFNLNINRAWVTQGYLFKLNDMHGKPESQATYAGNYNPNTFNETAYTSKTAYQYSQLGEPVRAMEYDATTNNFQLADLNLGTEEDLSMYRSRVTDRTNDFSLELDLNIAFNPLSIFLGIGLSYEYKDDQLSQHVTSKVIRQKTYLLTTTTTTDGVTQTTENLAYDRNTGDPVLTRTYDGFYAIDENINTANNISPTGANNIHHGEYFALNIPASWVYDEMSSKSDALSNSNQLMASAGSIVSYGANPFIDNTTGKVTTANNVNINNTGTPFKNIVNASATVYKKGWFNNNENQDALQVEYQGLANTINLEQANAHYYPQRTYIYRDQVISANTIDEAIYSGGIVDGNFDFFNWNQENNFHDGIEKQVVFGVNPGDREKWYAASEIVSYSPNGYPVQERDVLNINSAARFGYDKTLPVLVAQNAAYNQVDFIDFETEFDPLNLPEALNQEYAHSGNRSYDLSLDNNYVLVENYSLAPDIIANRGLTILCWLKSSLSNNVTSPNFGLKNPNPGLKARIGNETFNMNRIAQTGAWALYEVEIINFNGLTEGNYNIQLAYNFLPNEMVLIDDFKIQPSDAVTSTTVYTNDLRVAAQFDDQHFGVFYEYNNQRQLVRKSIETERGRRTLQEQQYNTPMIFRAN